MRVLRAFPAEKGGDPPFPGAKRPLELAWVFVLERQLGAVVWNDAFANGMPSGRTPPPPPDDWNELLARFESANRDYRNLIAGASEEDLKVKVHFMVGPKTFGEITRRDWLWFLLHDEIHHRGQLSVYLRAAGGKVPSIYGPSADEPWL